MMSQELHAFLRSRRTIRRFRNQPVPAETLERILQTALLAPSAHNLQPWRLLEIGSEAARRQLTDTLTATMRADMQSQSAPEEAVQARIRRTQRRIATAPVILLYCRDTEARRANDVHETHMGIQSVANIMLYTLLAAHAEGLGGNWICWPLYAARPLQQALTLPLSWLPEGMLFLGYPDESPPAPQRQALAHLLRRL